MLAENNFEVGILLSGSLKGYLKQLNIINTRSRIATLAGSVGMEELAAWCIYALIGMGAEIITLGLQQIGGQLRTGIAV